MDMSYTQMKKKKDRRTIEVPILEDQMKQPKPTKEPHEVILPTFQVSWVGLPSTIGGPRCGP
jgi:hypothetical protein